MYQPYLNQIGRTLESLSSDELRDLLNNDDKLDQRVDQAVKSLESEKEIVLCENRTLAESNLEKEPKLIELRSKVNDLSEHSRTLAGVVKEKAEELKSKSNNTNPDTVLALLQTAAAESEEESEALVKQFLDNEISVDVYLEKFLSSRKIMHSRKLKAEKMVELLRTGANQSRSGFPICNSVPGVVPYPQSSGFYPTTTVPYPVGPISMPMPGMFRPGPPY